MTLPFSMYNPLKFGAKLELLSRSTCARGWN